MAEKKKLGSAKKFGPRYGRTNRLKYSKIDALQKKLYTCPYCSYAKVKRVNTGIWRCDKCNAKFASKAYYIPKASSQASTQTEMPNNEEKIIEE